MWETLWVDFLAPLALLLSPLLSLAASIHILLTKEDVRAAIGWIGMVWLVPFAGVALYFLLGINRVARRARRGARSRPLPAGRTEPAGGITLREKRMTNLARLGAALTGAPLLALRSCEPLEEGDEAYPAMLEAIDRAQRRVWLESYIFDWDEIGARFAEHLLLARQRGVDVRILLDGVGALGTPRRLARMGLKAAAFHPLSPRHPAIFNLRCHRKLLIADDTAFLGSMNISARHLSTRPHPRRSRDVMFRIEGEIVAGLGENFAQDWIWQTGEDLPEGLLRAGAEEAARQTGSQEAPQGWARVVADGPDRELRILAWMFDAALSSAQRSVAVLTPYFVPDRDLVASLGQAALKGVDVDIYLPEKSNQPLVDLASRALWPELLALGCRIHLTPRPMDHSKLMVVDGQWAMIGSSNWDLRSLRLNFELNAEIYGRRAVRVIADCIARHARTARPLPASWGRTLPVWRRLGYRAAWLLTPYL
ncbi:MAG: cardiolipin synthase [Alphaproteobacteria bacterium]|nr:MAG: cardiolipin synthase [Alphaproteobacteria bacterium]